MAKAGEGLFKKYIPKDIHEKIRNVLEFKPKDPNRGWQVPAAKTTMPGLDNKQYRSPAPNSQPQANVPVSDNPDLLYDTSYYKRDTKRAPRQIHSYVAPAIRMLADERAKALELISNEVGPDEPAPSPGNKNPAVMRYDPTGLRTTMSTSNKAWEESLQKYMPNHNVKPWWWHSGVDHVAEAQAKGLPPPPGRRMDWEAPKGSKVASW
ncbi:unnamed protein product [Hapterophycus canaliculatus]